MRTMMEWYIRKERDKRKERKATDERYPIRRYVDGSDKYKKNTRAIIRIYLCYSGI